MAERLNANSRKSKHLFGNNNFPKKDYMSIDNHTIYVNQINVLIRIQKSVFENLLCNNKILTKKTIKANIFGNEVFLFWLFLIRIVYAIENIKKCKKSLRERSMLLSVNQVTKHLIVVFSSHICIVTTIIPAEEYRPPLH